MHIVYDKSLSRDERRQHWFELLAQWHQEQLPYQAFCDKYGLKKADLKRWIYRSPHFQTKQKNITLPQTTQVTKPSLFFLPVEVKESIRQTLVIHHNRGFSLTLDKNTDDVLFLKALQLLGELPC